MSSAENTSKCLQLELDAPWPKLIRLGGVLHRFTRGVVSSKNELQPVAQSLAGYDLLSHICVLQAGLRQCNIPGHETISL